LKYMFFINSIPLIYQSEESLLLKHIYVPVFSKTQYPLFDA